MCPPTEKYNLPFALAMPSARTAKVFVGLPTGNSGAASQRMARASEEKTPEITPASPQRRKMRSMPVTASPAHAGF